MKRHTHQRQAIRTALERADRPLGPQEILVAAQDLAPALGIATVYRNVKSLVEEGVLHTVELPGTPNRYEMAGKAHHHHFHCRSCDRVYEVDACPGSIKDLTPSGFVLESHEIILYGQCNSCTASSTSR